MIRAFDMFCGGGQGSSGAVSAGATMVGGIDAWELAAAVFHDNFPDAKVFTDRVERADPRRVSEEVGPVDLLMASPECTSHSCARGARPRSDESRDTALQVLRYARIMQPRWIVIENVVHMRPWSGYAELISGLRRLEYDITEHVLDAADYGVPQRRRRLFLLCDRETPAPTFVPKKPGRKPAAAGILDSPRIWATSPLRDRRRAQATLDRADRAIAALGEDAPFLIVYYGGDGAGGWQSLRVPLRTITTLDRFALCEPAEAGHTMRMLQVPELARAMGLGGGFRLERGSRRDRIMVLGNGVCPPVMEAVVRSLTASAEATKQRVRREAFADADQRLPA